MNYAEVREVRVEWVARNNRKDPKDFQKIQGISHLSFPTALLLHSGSQCLHTLAAHNEELWDNALLVEVGDTGLSNGDANVCRKLWSKLNMQTPLIQPMQAFTFLITKALYGPHNPVVQQQDKYTIILGE